MGGLLALYFGSCLGSLVNVMAYRMPKGESIVFPRSRCPHCRKTISWYDNVPVASWLMLRGRCRRCRGRISPRYPAVELSMALLALGLWLRLWPTPVWAGLAIAATAVYLAIALIDWDTFLIPDELSLGLLAAGLAVSPWNPILEGGAWYWPLAKSLLGAAIGLGICWGTAVVGERLFKKEAMGGGDIKLLAAVGAWSGGVGAFDCMIVASFFGSIYGVGQIVLGKLRRSDPIPFGPFLSAAAVFNFIYLLPLGFPFLTAAGR